MSLTYKQTGDNNMQLQIDGQGIEVTDAIRNILEKKLMKLESHFGNVERAHIVFKVNKIRQIADATLSLPGAIINAEAESEDMYKTIDLLVEKLNAQLSKHKDKTTRH